MTRYKILWDNGHACDAFAERYDTEEAAEIDGEAWLYEMCAIDGLDPEDECCPYSFEVIEVEEEPAPEPDEPMSAEEEAVIEGGLDYFNRYIAGDR